MLLYTTQKMEIINLEKIEAINFRYYIKALEDTAKEPLKHFKIDFYVNFMLNNKNIDELFCYQSGIETLRTKSDKICEFSDFKKYTPEQKEVLDKAEHLAQNCKKILAKYITKIFYDRKYPNISIEKELLFKEFEEEERKLKG